MLGVVSGLVLPVSQAWAHVEVSSEPAVAGASNAVVTFVAEAESDTAGVSAIQVQLPQGIGPGDVSWVSGPSGWALTPSVDGYEVSGPPLAVGEEARYAVRVRQLPDAASLAFRTIQRYTDGQTDRWLGLPDESSAEAENPAPLLTLAPAAATSTSTSTNSLPASNSPAAAPASPDDGLPGGVWLGIGALVVALLVVVAFVIRRRHTDAGGADG